MAVRLQRGRALESLSLTPLIDVVFLLLVFFLVASRFAQEDRAFPVELPAASSAKPLASKPEELVVSIDQAGGFHVQGKSLDEPTLGLLLARYGAEKMAQPMVTMRADRRAPVDAVVRVMDQCQKHGLTKYRITTVPMDRKP
jgi:biopolymer transport protein ExbD